MSELGARSKVAVSFYGKIKTIAQMVALILLIYKEPLFGIPIYSIGLVLLYVAALLTLWSMFQYIAVAWPKLREEKDNHWLVYFIDSLQCVAKIVGLLRE